MIMNRLIDEQRLIDTGEIAAYVGPQKRLGVEGAERRSVVAALVLTRLGNVIHNAPERGNQPQNWQGAYPRVAVVDHRINQGKAGH